MLYNTLFCLGGTAGNIRDMFLPYIVITLETRSHKIQRYAIYGNFKLSADIKALYPATIKFVSSNVKQSYSVISYD